MRYACHARPLLVALSCVQLALMLYPSIGSATPSPTPTPMASATAAVLPPSSQAGVLSLPSPAVASPMPAVASTPISNGAEVDRQTEMRMRRMLPDVPLETAVVGSSGPFVGISLQNAIAMALLRNTDLALSEANRRIAGYQVIADRGPFDLTFTVAPMYNFTTTPAVSPFEAGPNGGPTTQISQGVQAGFDLATSQGGHLSLNADAQSTQSNSTANAYNPFYSTSVSLNFTQPLGKGRLDKDRRDLLLAVANQHNQSAATLVSASATVTNVINTYWDLVAAWSLLVIQEQALAQARAQAGSNDRLAHRGSAAPVDVIEANTQVDVDQDNYYSALQNVARLENELKGLLLNDPSDPLWVANLFPTSPVAEIPPEPQLNAIIVAGLVHRPEFRTLAASRRTADIQLAYARDEARPQIDLQLQAQRAGFAGLNGNLSQNPIFTGFTPLFSSVNQLISAANAGLPANATPLAPLTSFSFPNPADTVGRLGQSWTSLWADKYPTYTAQISFALPLKNDRAKGDLGAAEEAERVVQIQEAQTIQRLIIDARNAVQAFVTARQRLRAAQAAQAAADRVLVGEQRRNALGRSTTFLVLQRQIESANDHGRVVQALADLNKAVAELDRVSGSVFEKHGIQLEHESQAVISARMRAAGVMMPAEQPHLRYLEQK